MNKDLVVTSELGGKHFAKGMILAWLVHVGSSNLKLLETATGLPGKLLSPLLAEVMKEKQLGWTGLCLNRTREGVPWIK